MEQTSERAGVAAVPVQAGRGAIDWAAVAGGAGMLALFAGLWALIQYASPNLAGNDDYFHIKLAQVMREQGVVPPFPWLPLTILNPADFFDHHFLYHVLLMPFAGGDLLAGAKLAGVIFPALAFWAGWLVLRHLRVPHSWLWALGFFAVSSAFLFRLSMIRVQAVSLAMLLLALVLLLKPGRPSNIWLGLLAFAYTWLYDAFPLLLALVVIFALARWLFDGEFDLWPLGAAMFGVGLGLLVNPYFPNNLLFIAHHYLPKLTDISAADINVGNEWYPYSTWGLVEKAGPALIALAAGALALGLLRRRMDGSTAALFFIALLFGGLLLKSRRFVEYFPAFALIFCAAAWSPLLHDWTRRGLPAGHRWPWVLALLFLPLIVLNIRSARAELQKADSFRRFAAASAWLVENSPPGSRLFQTDWDDFSPLFFYNTHNIYTLGLDPTYMSQRDPELYQLWRDTTRGWGNIGPVIRQDFGAAFAITDLEHDGFLDKAETDPFLQEVYRDEFAVIFAVRDEPDPNKKGFYPSE